VQETARELRELAYQFLEDFFVREMEAVFGDHWARAVTVG
jgi:hypothetical protein